MQVKVTEHQLLQYISLKVLTSVLPYPFNCME